MLINLLRTSYRSNSGLLILRRVPPKIVNVRYVDMIPATQYDTPFPERLKLRNAFRDNWEIIPITVFTFISLFVTFLHIVNAFRNKVDVIYTAGTRQCISRTMDLRNPTIHKIFTFNQRYDPWPEMQDVLDKMKVAERRAFVRAKSCSHA